MLDITLSRDYYRTAPAPRVSVLMTVYNSGEYIKRTMQSVLSQTFEDFEFIIINDGSTDNSDKIVKSFKDKRIRYYKFVKINKGYKNLYKAINFGLGLCKGEYIMRIDADDICRRDRIEKQKRFLDRNDKIFMIGTSCDIIDKDGKIIGEIIKTQYPSFLYKHRLKTSNPFIHSSIMFRNIGLLYPNSEEKFFYLSLVSKGKRLLNIKDKLVQYRINPNGVTANGYNNLTSQRGGN